VQVEHGRSKATAAADSRRPSSLESDLLFIEYIKQPVRICRHGTVSMSVRPSSSLSERRTGEGEVGDRQRAPGLRVCIATGPQAKGAKDEPAESGLLPPLDLELQPCTLALPTTSSSSQLQLHRSPPALFALASNLSLNYWGWTTTLTRSSCTAAAARRPTRRRRASLFSRASFLRVWRVLITDG